jgi:hypothetical protein
VNVKVVQLKIENFRGIQSADLHFDGHALLVGPNNVGKSTICEALDLVLGPDRLNKFPPAEEFDFYNGKYIEPNADPKAEAKPIPIRIEVTLIGLSAELTNKCGGHHRSFGMWLRSACLARVRLRCPRSRFRACASKRLLNTIRRKMSRTQPSCNLS